MYCTNKKECGFKVTIGFRQQNGCDWYYKENCKFHSSNNSQVILTKNKSKNGRQSKSNQ